MPRKPSFARHIREARISRGLSVAQLAERVGVTGPCIYFWETGRERRPRDTNLSALCKVLKLPVRATTGHGSLIGIQRTFASVMLSGCDRPQEILMGRLCEKGPHSRLAMWSGLLGRNEGPRVCFPANKA